MATLEKIKETLITRLSSSKPTEMTALQNKEYEYCLRLIDKYDGSQKHIEEILFKIKEIRSFYNTERQEYYYPVYFRKEIVRGFETILKTACSNLNFLMDENNGYRHTPFTYLVANKIADIAITVFNHKNHDVNQTYHNSNDKTNVHQLLVLIDEHFSSTNLHSKKQGYPSLMSDSRLNLGDFELENILNFIKVTSTNRKLSDNEYEIRKELLDIIIKKLDSNILSFTNPIRNKNSLKEQAENIQNILLADDPNRLERQRINALNRKRKLYEKKLEKIRNQLNKTGKTRTFEVNPEIMDEVINLLMYEYSSQENIIHFDIDMQEIAELYATMYELFEQFSAIEFARLNARDLEKAKQEAAILISKYPSLEGKLKFLIYEMTNKDQDEFKKTAGEMDAIIRENIVKKYILSKVANLMVNKNSVQPNWLKRLAFHYQMFKNLKIDSFESMNVIPLINDEESIDPITLCITNFQRLEEFDDLSIDYTFLLSNIKYFLTYINQLQVFKINTTIFSISDDPNIILEDKILLQKEKDSDD